MGLFAVGSLYATKNKASRVKKNTDSENVTDSFFSCASTSWIYKAPRLEETRMVSRLTPNITQKRRAGLF